MKTINLFLFLIMAFTMPILMTAQNDGASSKSKQQTPFCEDLIQNVRADLQIVANETCTTVRKTFACEDKNSRIPVWITLIVQPEIANCPDAAKIENTDLGGPKSRGKAPDFTVEVIQKKCSNGGITLHAYVPEMDVSEKKRLFDYQWMTDGEVFDTDRTAECVTASKITLKVEKIDNGQTVIKSVTVAPKKQKQKDGQLIGFKKTACFGKCPVYEVSISKNGKATWKGIANVDKMGDFTATVGQSKLDYLMLAFKSAKFVKLENAYPVEGKIADGAGTVTTFNDGEKVKVVTNKGIAPEHLTELESIIEKTISSLAWKRTVLD